MCRGEPKADRYPSKGVVTLLTRSELTFQISPTLSTADNLCTTITRNGEAFHYNNNEGVCVCVLPSPQQKFLILFIETLTRNISRLWCNASQWDFRPRGGYSSCLCSLGPVHKQDQHLLQFRPHNTSKYLH